MRFLGLLSLASLTWAGTIQKRASAEDVNNDITGIDIAVRNLTAVVTAYQGGIKEASPIFAAALAIHDINRKGFRDAKAAPPFTSAESKVIADNVQDSVGVSIPAGVTIIEGKKPLFDAAELTSLIKATIDLLKGDHESFSLAVATKLSLDQFAPAAAGAGKIDASLQKASLYYTL